ncbi:MAG: bifunctional phosphopantothenoylcysteine decarboxylase/phosphopantothenate--cysteine ligase CoaBC [Chitinophagales bacterium]
MLKDKKILLAVCGSIAAYKAAFLVRLLVKEGAQVRVIMTKAATEFISPLTMATLSKNECVTDYINASKTNWNNHVDLALWADMMLIAPASSGTISKMANGLCDNLLMAVYMSARCPVYLAPAMDEDMWKHASTKQNIQKLVSFGNKIITVNNGELASGLIGEGRMAEPQEIIEHLFYDLRLTTHDSKFSGKKILITAGPTYEALDPVRFIGNHSSGKMGIALAKAAHDSGADVHLIIGPTKLPIPSGIKVTHVMSANEMYAACKKDFAKADVCIFAAAVADYTPKNVAEQKIKKSDAEFSIVLKKNVDIALEFGKIKKVNQLSIGFALETNNELNHAKAKIAKKNFDLIVLNSLNDKGAGFKHATNKITIVNRNNKIHKFELKSKDEVAIDILKSIENILK